MKKIWPAMMLSLLLSSCSNTPSYQHVSMSEAIDLMNRESSYVILDVRTYDEYQQGHIPGAIVVPNETIGTSEIPELPDKQQMILVYCHSGNRSRQAAAKLAKLGYSNVIEFGGIIDWPLEIVKD